MQPKKVTEKFFPEYEKLEVTPGLQKRGYTNYDELISFRVLLKKFSKIFL